MANSPSPFDPRQKMLQPDFEVVHKWDTVLKEVEVHHHDFYEVNFLVSGDVTYVVESRVYHVKPGQMLIINPRELHQVYIKPDAAPYERYMLWVAPSLLQGLSSLQTDLCRCFDMTRPHYDNLLHVPAEQRRIIPALFEALVEAQAKVTYGSDLLQRNLLTELMIHVNRLADLPSDNSADSKDNTMVARVIDYINEHYQESLSLDQLAEQFFVSKYHLSHEFTRQMGTGIYQYIQKKRLLIARQLILGGQKPTEVFAPCGFGDYAAFFRAFKKIYGISPRDYVQSLDK